VPVIASGTIHDPQLAERLVRDGDADFVSMARPMFADPRLAEKIISNAVEDIRPCIRCNTCLAREQGGLRGYCAVNPRTGREHRVSPLPDRKKAVAVIGAGPAGIEAALTAAARGHSVTLHERTGRIGGQLAAAALLPFKSTLSRLLRYYQHALDKAGVKVVLQSIPLPESVDAEHVILATGSRWPGSRDVLGCLDVLRDPGLVQHRVTVVGANTIGAEIAWWLGSLGKQVTLVERDAEFDDDVNLIQRLVLPKALADAGVSVVFNTEFSAGKWNEPAVLACGAVPDLPPLGAWRAGGRVVALAGECAGARMLIGATTSAYEAALRT
jgi:NADPH-dependent 2,4-dienoyl-CoA reductase/sulfur reductase-like enzyme